MPIGLNPGWNQIQFNLAEFTKRAYGSTYLETVRIQIHANVRIRRIYFSDRLYANDEMPHEFKLFFPIAGTHKMQDQQRKTSKESDKKASKEPLRESLDRVQLIEQEIPSVAPPATPEAVTAREEPPPEAPVVEAPPAPEAPAEEPAAAEEAEAPPAEGEAPPAEEGEAPPAEAEAAPAEGEGEGEPPSAEAAGEELSTITEEPTITEEAPAPAEEEAEEPLAEAAE